jgi:hypothetical protein
MLCKREKLTELIFTGLFLAYRGKKKLITLLYDSYLCATVFSFIRVLHLHKLLPHKSQMHVYFESDSESVNTYFFFCTKGMTVHGYCQFLKHEQKERYAFIVICVRSNVKSCNVMTYEGIIILVPNEALCHEELSG